LRPPPVVQATDQRVPMVDRLVREVLGDEGGSMLSGTPGNLSWERAVEVARDLHPWGKLRVVGRLTVVMVKPGARCVLGPESVVMVRPWVRCVAEPEFVVALGSHVGGHGGVFVCA
jgi:hypothetical protein